MQESAIEMRSEQRKNKFSQEQTFNKNSFMITHNGFSFKNMTNKTITQLQTILNYIEKNQQKILKHGQMEPKMYRLLLKNRQLLEKWSNVQYLSQQTAWIIREFYNNIPVQRYLPIKNKKWSQQHDPRRKVYWKNTIEVHDMRLKSLSKFSEIKNKNKDQNSYEKINQSTSRDQQDNQQPNLSSINPHLMTIVKIMSVNMQFYLFLPTMLKVKLLGIKQIDQVNQRATLSVQIQLKTKLPTRTSEHFQALLKKLMVFVKSGKFKKQEGSVLSFHESNFNEGYEEISIWNNLENYYSFIENWKDQTYDKISDKIDQIQEEDVIVYRAVIQTTSKITTYDFNSPFDILDLQGTVQLFPIYTSVAEWEQQLQTFFIQKLNELDPLLVIKLNLVETQEQDKIGAQIYAQKNIEIDGYKIANSLQKIQISDFLYSQYQLKNYLFGWKWMKKYQNKDEEKSSTYKMYKGDSVAHYHFPIYRDPLNPLTAIFVTNIVLGVIMFFVFFQDPQELADRIANISALLISFVAMIAILQEQMKRSKVSITALLVYLMILTPLLCMADSIYLFQRPDVQNKPLENPLFWICVVITALNVIYPIFMIILFFCCIQQKFTHCPQENKYSIMPGHDDLNKVKNNKINTKSDPKKLLRIRSQPSSQIFYAKSEIKKYCQFEYFKLMQKAFAQIESLGDVYTRFDKYFTGQRRILLNQLLSGKKQLNNKIGGTIEYTLRVYNSQIISPSHNTQARQYSPTNYNDTYKPQNHTEHYHQPTSQNYKQQQYSQNRYRNWPYNQTNLNAHQYNRQNIPSANLNYYQAQSYQTTQQNINSYNQQYAPPQQATYVQRQSQNIYFPRSQYYSNPKNINNAIVEQEQENLKNNRY